MGKKIEDALECLVQDERLRSISIRLTCGVLVRRCESFAGVRIWRIDWWETWPLPPVLEALNLILPVYNLVFDNQMNTLELRTTLVATKMTGSTTRSVAGWNIAAAICASLSLLTHLWVGQIEEARFTLVPVGHASILAMVAWLVTVLVATLSLIATRGHARVAWIALVLSCVGASVLWWGRP